MDWEAVWEDSDNDANGEWSPETYRALTTQKSIEGSGIGILPLSHSWLLRNKDEEGTILVFELTTTYLKGERNK